MSLFTYPWECPGLHFFTLFATKTWNDFSMEISLVDFWTMPCRQGRQFISALRFLPFFSHFFSLAAQGSRPPFFDYDCASLRPRLGREFTRFCRRLRRRLKKPLRPLVDWNTLYQEARVGAKPGWGEMVRNVCFEVQRSIQAAQAGKGEGLSRFQIQKIDLHSAPRILCIWSWCKVFPTIGLGGNLPRPPKLLVSQLQRDTTQPLILIVHIP